MLYLKGFWIKYFIYTYLTGFLNVSDFIKKTLNHIDAWPGSDYSSGSAYTKVLDMPGLQEVLNKNDVSKILSAFQIFLRFSTCHGSKYARVVQVSD